MLKEHTGAMTSQRTSVPRTVARIALGTALALAGISHLTTARKEFRAQVPTWLPADPDTVVVASGVVEIALGTALVALPKQRRVVGRLAAAFFTAIFPGNISQLVTKTDAFGLNTDRARTARLGFQPLLVALALWSTGKARSRR
jgi:uncharacterized membrane protein